MFRWVTAVERGDWIADRLGPFGGWVGSVVPRGFDAYARVLHRACDGASVPVRWAQVAASTGSVLHPTAQWWKVARRPDWCAQQPIVAHDEPWPDGYDPVRHVGLMQLPMWDLDASLAELHRMADAGLRGVNFPAPSASLTP